LIYAIRGGSRTLRAISGRAVEAPARSIAGVGEVREGSIAAPWVVEFGVILGGGTKTTIFGYETGD
jgi:hypothetical protein